MKSEGREDDQGSSRKVKDKERGREAKGRERE